MKLAVTLILLLITAQLRAQRVTGILMGEVTRMPLAHATVSAGGNTVLSNAYGIFTITWARPVDSIRIICAGYNNFAIKPPQSRSDTLILYLKPVAYTLHEVVVRSQRNTKADSLRMRKEFANVFAYKTSIADVMVTHPYVYVPYNYIDAPKSTASIVGFDVLKLVSYFNKNKNTTLKLRATLIKAEHDNYVDNKFSKEKVNRITNLKGDSLSTFMLKYTPAITQLQKMSDYELVTYIKKSSAEFRKK